MDRYMELALYLTYRIAKVRYMYVQYVRCSFDADICKTWLELRGRAFLGATWTPVIY